MSQLISGNLGTEIPINLKSIDKCHMIRLMCHIPFHMHSVLCALTNLTFKVTLHLLSSQIGGGSAEVTHINGITIPEYLRVQ